MLISHLLLFVFCEGKWLVELYLFYYDSNDVQPGIIEAESHVGSRINFYGIKKKNVFVQIWL